MVCFTTLLTVSLNEQKFLILMCSKWSFISPVLAVMDSLKKKKNLLQGQKVILPYYFLEVFYNLNL